MRGRWGINDSFECMCYGVVVVVGELGTNYMLEISSANKSLRLKQAPSLIGNMDGTNLEIYELHEIDHC